MVRRFAFLASLMVVLLCGCKGIVTSATPLLVPRDASYPIASGAEVIGQSLDDSSVWEKDEHKAQLVLVDGYYRVIEPDQSSPSPDRFLVRQVGNQEFIVQASNGSGWAYGLIVHADMYYLFAFDRAEENCTKLSASELARFHTVIKDDDCQVASLNDLIGLLRYLRSRFPHPTSAFAVRRPVR